MFQAYQCRRLLGVGVLLAAGFAGLGYRLVQLQWLRHAELSEKAQAFTRVVRSVPAWRGEIQDRQGVRLAVSVPVKTVQADLRVCTNRLTQVASAFAAVLGTNADWVGQRLRQDLRGWWSEGQYCLKQATVLRRNVTPAEWEAMTNALARDNFGYDPQNLTPRQRFQLHTLRRRALFATEDQKRLYLFTNSLSQVLGYVVMRPFGRGWRGACGVERALERELAGAAAVCVSQQDAQGNELAFRRLRFREAADGKTVRLTIDLGLQQMVERLLADAVSQRQPKHASVIVVQPRTGEVLAWACLPAFSPENPGAAPLAAWSNHPLSDMVEPGSTFKIVVLAACLNEGLMTLDHRVFGEYGRVTLLGVTLRDHAPYGWLSVRESFAKSSNVAHAKYATLLGAARLYHYITNFGFGHPTGLELAGEVAGRIPPPGVWTGYTLTRAAIGQGIAITQLQLTMAAAAIANEGRLMRPFLVRQILGRDGQVLYEARPQCVRAVVTPAVAAQVKAAMTNVVSRGNTGWRAACPGYEIAGKTGTAQKADHRGYLAGRYYASFVGFFPAEDPELCISVAFDEPAQGYYGGEVAAPLFAAIASRAGAYLASPPDKAPNPPLHATSR